MVALGWQVGYLVEFSDTEKIFNSPQQQATQDYVSGFAWLICRCSETTSAQNGVVSAPLFLVLLPVMSRQKKIRSLRTGEARARDSNPR